MFSYTVIIVYRGQEFDWEGQDQDDQSDRSPHSWVLSDLVSLPGQLFVVKRLIWRRAVSQYCIQVLFQQAALRLPG